MTTPGEQSHRREVIVSKCDEHGDIGPIDDGYQMFWVNGRGALSATDLRIIADELDRRNKQWDDQVRSDT